MRNSVVFDVIWKINSRVLFFFLVSCQECLYRWEVDCEYVSVRKKGKKVKRKKRKKNIVPLAFIYCCLFYISVSDFTMVIC